MTKTLGVCFFLPLYFPPTSMCNVEKNIMLGLNTLLLREWYSPEYVKFLKIRLS